MGNSRSKVHYDSVSSSSSSSSSSVLLLEENQPSPLPPLQPSPFASSSINDTNSNLKHTNNDDSFGNRENLLSIIVLAGLTSVYLYLLLDPKQPRLAARPKNFVLKPDTRATFDSFTAEYKKGYDSSSKYSYGSDRKYNYSYGSSSHSYKEWGKGGNPDDFFLDASRSGKDDFYPSRDGKDEKSGPIVPSTNYRCQEGWLAIRAELNYKYLWMHAGEHGWMGATATMDTPLHRRSFEIHPVNESCADGHGWVRLREGDSQGFLMMVAPTGAFAVDEWVVKVGSESIDKANEDPQYHFLLEEDGYMLNHGSMAFVNIMPEAEYSVRGHTGGWDRTKAAGREYGAQVKFSFVNESLVQEAIDEEAIELKETEEEDKLYRQQIAAFPKSTEKRVISFGLYGAKEKYTLGAIHNAELAQTYFPGWICRFYVTSDVPSDTVDALKKLGAEVEQVPAGMGYSSGMFWRFMPAADSSVDRFIVRDVDSRLNARDRIAVEEWIESKLPVHILRDHVNHCIVMNGGMWGAVKDALPNMKELIMAWSSRDEYMADLHFLQSKIWPEIKDKQISHDSYCCDRYPNTKPFPTRRYKNYQHVGQVFDSEDHPRMMDIDGFIRGVPVPGKCRKKTDWIYG